MKLLISHLLFNPIKFGFYPLHSPPTIHINGPFRSITCDLLTSSSSDLFLFLIPFHFSEAFHNADTPLPFDCPGATYAWLCSCSAGHLPSILVSATFYISGQLPALSFTLFSSSSNEWVSGRHQNHLGDFLNYSHPLPRSWVFSYIPHPAAE